MSRLSIRHAIGAGAGLLLTAVAAATLRPDPDMTGLLALVCTFAGVCWADARGDRA